MPSREEKLRYLSHHVSYELLMLRYTYARLHDTSHKLTLSKDRLRMARHGILSWLTPTITSPDKVVPDACTHPFAYTLTIPQQYALRLYLQRFLNRPSANPV
jgi:hypothetical protein